MGTSRQRNLHDFFKTTREVSTQYKLYACVKCLIKIRGQTWYKQHVESCDKHYCQVCNKNLYSSQTYGKHLKKLSSSEICLSELYTDIFKKSDRNTHNRKCIKTRNYKYDFSKAMQTQRNQYHYTSPF